MSIPVLTTLPDGTIVEGDNPTVYRLVGTVRGWKVDPPVPGVFGPYRTQADALVAVRSAWMSEIAL